ncbi:hypothetical protein DICPUDRAFT_148335 [Dictyostelium purpureum]|uniref:Glycoside hydrolase family 5 domain-containing protein n=1 Tax=Dictyostelium purpureum TaxID=5786 RepID=F0ZAV1_DICPU|nr:uncharacterized protein DICPUDRAFT_148335 [Dictyostelium purpureum]EGC38983.1 hypothetical protein DICPUDRAFT_148335 [Dictyostelium purpureum]|eukprot:XP_003284548.1 hypothetical protein DICPUDRAFT_148335 [Dictyostelium purpureum]
MIIFKYLISLLLLFSLISNVFCIIKVNPSNQFFIDEYNRVRLFHGVNVVYKIPPFHPSLGEFDPVTSFNQEDINNLESWGFNAVRLGVMWPGVEPEYDQFNQTYLSIMKELVEQMAESNIYTLIDFHQDLLSRKFCGEGIPDWAVNFTNTDNFPLPVAKTYPKNSQSYPDLNQCLNKDFGVYYFSKDVGELFQMLYDNTNGLQDQMIDYWRVLVKTFMDLDTVLGYEIINEPWAGDIYENIEYILKLGYADEKNLLPLYQAVNQAIREIDQEHCVFYEKALTDLIHSRFPAGTPGGVEYNDRQVLSYHIYCGTTRQGNPRHTSVCDGEEDLFFEGAMDDLKRTGGGGFMTEFGAVSNETNSIDMLNYLTGHADKYLQSWTYWQLKYYNDITTAGSTESLYLPNGELDIPKITALSRTYAQAIAGVPQAMKYDTTDATFTLTYTIDTTITQPTIVYLNEQLQYPNGYTAKITQGTATLDQSKTNYILITPSSATQNQSTITLTVTKN